MDLRFTDRGSLRPEILTKDKVSLRVNLSAVYRIADPVKARGDLGNIASTCIRTLQFGLRQAIGTQPLDGLLGDKDQLDRVVRNYVAERVEPHGLALETVGIKDVILPGEMKDILNQVVTAEKAAQANVIRRRGSRRHPLAAQHGEADGREPDSVAPGRNWRRWRKWSIRSNG